jgi:hypothetical protein
MSPFLRQVTRTGCGGKGVNNCGSPALSAVNCFGVKPDYDTSKVYAFGSSWADPAAVSSVAMGAVTCSGCAPGR